MLEECYRCSNSTTCSFSPKHGSRTHHPWQGTGPAVTWQHGAPRVPNTQRCSFPSHGATSQTSCPGASQEHRGEKEKKEKEEKATPTH